MMHCGTYSNNKDNRTKKKKLFCTSTGYIQANKVEFKMDDSSMKAEIAIISLGLEISVKIKTVT